MNPLTDSQRKDLADLARVCQSLSADMVIIGATAYRILIDDSDRHTLDIDLALTLDLDNFAHLQQTLSMLGWQMSPRLEHRWTTADGNRFDLIPAGPALRKTGRLVWPRSGMVMSLAGFDHVFRRAIQKDLGELLVKVVPLTVLALLKIVAFLERPDERGKDLDDLQRLFNEYEADSDRLFSDAVFEANLSDVEYANAFLLGWDLRAIVVPEETELVRALIARLERPRTDFSSDPGVDEDSGTHRARRFQYQLRAFAQAFLQP